MQTSLMNVLASPKKVSRIKLNECEKKFFCDFEFFGFFNCFLNWATPLLFIFQTFQLFLILWCTPHKFAPLLHHYAKAWAEPTAERIAPLFQSSAEQMDGFCSAEQSIAKHSRPFCFVLYGCLHFQSRCREPNHSTFYFLCSLKAKTFQQGSDQNLMKELGNLCIRVKIKPSFLDKNKKKR